MSFLRASWCNAARISGRLQRSSAGFRSNNRTVHTGNILKQSEKNATPTENAATGSAESKGALFGHKVTPIEKYMLVWTKKYPSVKDVPEIVSFDMMTKTKNKTRIWINVGMICMTLLSCLAMIQLGKRDLEQGISVQKMNLEWHKKIKEEEEAKKNPGNK